MHALLKNLLLQCFSDALITFIKDMILPPGVISVLFLPDEGDHSIIETLQKKILNNFEQCMSEYRAGVSQTLLL